MSKQRLYAILGEHRGKVQLWYHLIKGLRLPIDSVTSSKDKWFYLENRSIKNLKTHHVFDFGTTYSLR